MSYTSHDQAGTFSWPDNYYAETSGEKREKLLKAQLELDDSSENRIRYRLFEKRYMKPKKGAAGVDYYMKFVMELDIISEKQGLLSGRQSVARKVREARDLFCLDLLKDNPGLSHLWTEEFTNFWSLYIEICRKDSNYSGLLLGMGHMSEDQLALKIREDIYRKAVLLPERLGLETELTPYREAAMSCLDYYQ